MKKFYPLCIVCLSIGLLISCSKDDDNEQNNNLNKLEYDGKLYSPVSFNVEELSGEYFIYHSYCHPDDSRYAYKFSFYNTKSINQYTTPLFIVNIGPFTKGFHDSLPIELNSNLGQSYCTCSSVLFTEENNMNSLTQHISVMLQTKIISINPIEIKLEGVFENDKNFKFHFRGKSIPGFPYGI